MEKAITDFLSTQRPIVTALKAARHMDNKRTLNCHPWCYLILGLSKENIDLICAEGFISNPHATLHVLHFDPLPSHTGDGGPNTHWVHGENIESIVNM